MIKIYIDSSKPYYYPGEHYAATILLEVSEKVNCDKMCITVKGKQMVDAIQKAEADIDSYLEQQEEEKDDSDSDEQKNKKKKISNIFRNQKDVSEEEEDEKSYENKEIKECQRIFKYQKIIQLSNNNYIAQGRYSYPLEVDLPENIPGSFVFMTPDAYVEIIYTIKVKLNKLDIKECMPIVIRQKEKSFKYQTSNEYTKALKGCCFDSHESTIKLSTLNKYMINTNEIKLNVLIDNTNSNLQGSPMLVELYQKVTIFPKNLNKQIKITKSVGKYKGKRYLPARNVLNRDVSFLMNKSEYTSKNIQYTKSAKYFKHKDVIPFLNQSIISDFVNCEYEAYAEVQFTNWIVEELGVFLPILIYPPEKGILSKSILHKSKEFVNSILNKKSIINEQTKDEDPEFENKKKKTTIEKQATDLYYDDSDSEEYEKNKNKNTTSIMKVKQFGNNEEGLEKNIEKNIENNGEDKFNKKENIQDNMNINGQNIINENNQFNKIENVNNKNPSNNIMNEQGSFGNSQNLKKSVFNFDKNSNNIKKDFSQNFLNDVLDDEYLDKESQQ